MKSRFLACAALTVLSIASVACEKKVAKAPPPPPPPARESAPATVASTPSRPAPAAPYRAPAAQSALNSDAQTLGEIVKQYPDFHLTVEGYCDERGSEEYNLALGDARAKQAKEYLAGMGVPGDQLRIVSFGKDRPICMEHDEACWQKNRRAHITQAQ